jgi:hypothetical protein
MPTDSEEQPIKIAWDDLTTRKVDQRLREQEAVARNRKQAELNPLTTAQARSNDGSIWRNSVFILSLFGLLGGLLAWGAGEACFTADPYIEARQQVALINQLSSEGLEGKRDPSVVRRSIAEIKTENADNPYFVLYTDTTLTAEQRQARLAEVQQNQRARQFVSNLLSYGLYGLLISVCLSIAEPVSDRNYAGALVNCFVGAATGVVGGVVVSTFIDYVYKTMMAGVTDANRGSTQIFAHAVKWGVLGLFLTIGPGLVMRNIKKLTIGLIGGLVGGFIGGTLYDPIFTATGNDHISKLAALGVIGLFAGLGTGLIENAAKAGWVKVTAGLITGKQFILYRNPTFIGSGPECPIYLFRDPQVGKRHAAIHIVPGGFELENLPLGAETLVNGRPITRTKLRGGDEIGVGITRFVFHEKTKK